MPALVFILFTFSAFIMFFVLPKSDFSAMEKRYLAETPNFSFQNLMSGELVKEIDGDSEKGTSGYVADHFPLRSFFVGLHSYYNLIIGNTANSDYYYCKDGYIVTKPYDTSRFEKNIGVLNDFSENLNLTVAVVPSAGYVMADKLPVNHTSYSDSFVFAELKAKLSENINYCDLEKAMLDYYKDGTSPFYKTDHHWTTSGAFCAYNALGETLGFEPLDEENFHKTVHSGFCGTTYSSSGYFLRDADTLEVWESKKSKNITVEIFEGQKSTKYYSMYFEEHLSEPDMYPVFLDGNHPLVKIQNPDAEGGKLLVLKDSFAHALTPFLAENYSEIVMVDMRYYKESISELCKQEGIEDGLVLYGISNFCTDAGLAFLE